MQQLTIASTQLSLSLAFVLVSGNMLEGDFVGVIILQNFTQLSGCVVTGGLSTLRVTKWFSTLGEFSNPLIVQVSQIALQSVETL